MNTGMLWFDNDPKTALSAKIEKAVAYYYKKYGCKPNLCLINPDVLAANEKETDKSATEKVTVRPYRPVLPGHLWIGVEEKKLTR
jgi:hypothetical protein